MRSTLFDLKLHPLFLFIVIFLHFTNVFLLCLGFILWWFVSAFEWQTRQSKGIYRQDVENGHHKRGTLRGVTIISKNVNQFVQS